MTKFDSNLAPAFARGAAAVIASLRREIAALSAALEPAGSRRLASRVVRATLTSQLVRLDDCYAGKLRGYCTVHEEVARLDPVFDRLRSGVIQLISLMRAEDAGHA